MGAIEGREKGKLKIKKGAKKKIKEERISNVLLYMVGVPRL